jgi:hypothetical protein
MAVLQDTSDRQKAHKAKIFITNKVAKHPILAIEKCWHCEQNDQDRESGSESQYSNMYTIMKARNTTNFTDG